MLSVTNYHYIRTNFDTSYPSIFGVKPTEFEKQLVALQTTGTFIHPNELLFDPEKIIASNENYILITFDDGLKEQVDLALPVLEKLGIPALFFINTLNHVEKKVSLVHKIHLVRSVVSTAILYVNIKKFTNRKLTNDQIQDAMCFYRFDDKESAEFKYFLNVVLDYKTQEAFINQIFRNYFDEKLVVEELYMSTNQLKELIDRGFVGSHTHSHLPLGLYDEKTIKRELSISKKYLENLGNTKIECVSYPYGTAEAVSQLVVSTAKEVGYKFGFTTKPLLNDSKVDYLLLNRFDCNDSIGGKNFK